MSPPRAQRLAIRGLQYNLLRWGHGRPGIFLLHGWLDVAATFAPLARAWAALAPVAAPDWRGFGDTDSAPGGYWFPDYLADLDAMLDEVAPEQPVILIGHSMGAQIASLYAGLRPARVSRLVVLDGLFMPDMAPELAPKRLLGWLDDVRSAPRQRSYDSFEQLAGRIAIQHPRLSPQRALEIAQCWGRRQADGRIALCADPRHHWRFPTLYRAAESMAVWRQITAPTLFVDGADSPFGRGIGSDETAARRACFAHHQAVTVPDAGHMLHFDAPEVTASRVLEWLRNPVD